MLKEKKLWHGDRPHNYKRWCEAWLKEVAEPADNLGDRNDWLTPAYGGNASKGDTPRVCFDMRTI